MALGATPRSRLFALLSVLMLAVQFPLTQLKVPQRFAADFKEDTFFMSILQVAVSAYHRNPAVSEDFLKWLWLPGLAGYDAHNWLQCHFDKEHEACAKPAYTKQLDSVFTMTEPLVARSDIVLAALKENFAGSADLVQMGATLTLGTAIISLVYPVKIGIMGYVIILYGMFKHNLQPSPPALLFAFVFLIAVRAMSIFSAGAEAQAAKSADAARAELQSALSTAKAPAAEGQDRATAKRTD